MTPPTTTDRRRFGPALATGCLAVIAISACSAENEPGTTPVENTPDEPSTELTITMEEIPGMDSSPATYTLTCDPVGGDLADAEEACSALEGADGDLFAPVSDTQACLQIYNGPGEITVTGTWDDEAIDAVFNRTNSCETERFDAVASTFGIEVAA